MSLVTLGLLSFANTSQSFEFPEKLPEEFPLGEISVNVSYYSQYIWRGEQQNTGQSAIQGGFDWGMNLVDTYVDVYAGIWGSNVSGGTNSLSGNELEEGEFKLGDLVVRVNKIKTYEKDLIVCEEK